jgi:hypothetical protein
MHFYVFSSTPYILGNSGRSSGGSIFHILKLFELFGFSFGRECPQVFGLCRTHARGALKPLPLGCQDIRCRESCGLRYHCYMGELKTC